MTTCPHAMIFVPPVDIDLAEKCDGRNHKNHALATCEGSCCFACGGPVDGNGECRCTTK